MVDPENGPPRVSRSIRVKLLKLNAKVVMSSGAVATSSNGSTTVRKAYRLEAPSTNAASFRSAGTAVSAPEQTRKKYGKPIHRLTNRTENFASHGSFSNWLL